MIWHFVLVLLVLNMVVREDKKLSFKAIADHEIQDQINWTAQGGNWDLSEKVFHGQGFIGHNKIYFNKYTLSNFIFEVNISKLSQNGPIGILFHYDDKTDSGYLFQYWPFGGYELQLIQGGRDILKRFATYNSHDKVKGLHLIKGLTNWNKLKIIVQDSKAEIYINDKLTFVVDQLTKRSGHIGLYMNGEPRQKALFNIISLRYLENR